MCIICMCTLNANCTLVHVPGTVLVWYGTYVCTVRCIYVHVQYLMHVVYIVLVNSTTITSTGSVQFMCNPINS